jgi:hypothetical protein
MTELESFVFDYLKEAGGIVEPAVYGVHEVLLPEHLAEQWHVQAYQQITFAEEDQDNTTHLNYNHPLVEQMVQEAHSRPASTRLFANRLRLDKTGLEELAARSWVVLNGRVTPQTNATSARVRSTYVRFNFKTAILSDEKTERLVSVMMDAHAGHRVVEAEPIESQAMASEPDALLKSLPDAPVRWGVPGDQTLKAPLDQRALEGLLERARSAVLDEMAEVLNALQKRVTRFHVLDEARLTEYYDELEQDLIQRIRTASPERQAGLQDKLQAVRAERAHKLADLAQRYQVQVNLTLLNLLVIQQPKLVVPINVENRTSKVTVYAVWDPLLRCLEPLVCQVCGQPARRIYLCYNGHLAHEGCLAPACIDCKRVFCGHCAHEIGECDVCHRPLCGHSRMVCPECGRGTCQAHKGLCHINEGQPVDLSVSATSPRPEREPPPSPVAESATKAQAADRAKSKSKPQRQPPRKPQPVPARLREPALNRPKGVPKPQRMEVVVHPNAVAAYVLASRERQIASRVWELSPNDGGIVRTCECEKGEACKANHMILRPSDWTPIETQLKQEITAFRQEYGLPDTKVKFNRVSSLDGTFFPVARFELSGLWKDKAVLDEARKKFAELYWK